MLHQPLTTIFSAIDEALMVSGDVQSAGPLPLLPSARATLRRRALWVVPLTWGVITALQLITVVLADRPIGVSGWLSVSTTFPLVALSAWALFACAMRFRERSVGQKSTALVIVIALCAAIVGPVDAAKDIALMDWLEPQPHRGLLLMALAGFINYVLLFGVLAGFFVSWIEGAKRDAGLAALTAAREAEASARLRATHAEGAATEARLAALRYQLNPHFLFNTLNAISSMVVTGRNAVAEGMLDKLCAFLRTTLTAKPAAMVLLEDELATIASYLEIESFRLRERLTVEFDCPPPLNDALVPGFLLQPLVENAIKHGVGATSRPVRLEIGVQTEEEAVLVLRVSDDGGADGATRCVPGLGVGLENVAERLRSTYGPRASLQTARLSPGFAAVVRLPLTHAHAAAEQELAA